MPRCHLDLPLRSGNFQSSRYLAKVMGDQMTEKDSNPAWTLKFSAPCVCLLLFGPKQVH